MATDDYVTRFEQRVDNAAHKSADRIKNLIRQKYTRQPFSQKVDDEAMGLEYDLMKDDPQMLSQFALDQHGSVESFVKYIETMEKRRASSR